MKPTPQSSASHLQLERRVEGEVLGDRRLHLLQRQRLLRPQLGQFRVPLHRQAQHLRGSRLVGGALVNQIHEPSINKYTCSVPDGRTGQPGRPPGCLAAHLLRVRVAVGLGRAAVRALEGPEALEREVQLLGAPELGAVGEEEAELARGHGLCDVMDGWMDDWVRLELG